MSGHKGTEPTVFVVDDDPPIRNLVSRALTGAGYQAEVFADGEACLEGLSRALPDAIVLDLSMPGPGGLEVLDRIKERHPDIPVVILTATTAVSTVVTAMRKGAWDYLVKPIDGPKLLTTLKNAVDHSRMSLRLAQLEREAGGVGYPRMVGRSAPMRALFRQLDRACRGDVTVLIHGESGTGKELVAQALHENGPRRAGPFVALNCAAIPEGLQESELFGHEKGAFTGAASRRIGRFEQADRGTLFLDEVAELVPALQAKLLRVLQQRSFQRVGGLTEIKPDFRLVAATHRDLAEEVRAGRFREDLYYRIAVFEIDVPPLRGRAEDIPLLVDAFLDEHRGEGGAPLRVSPEALALLTAHPWPGNVRELHNALEQAATVASGVIGADDLPARVRGLPRAVRGPVAAAAPAASHPAAGAAVAAEGASTATLTMRDLERQAIQEALRRTGGNVSEAGRQLGLGRATLYRKLKEYGLK